MLNRKPQISTHPELHGHGEPSSSRPGSPGRPGFPQGPGLLAFAVASCDLSPVASPAGGQSVTHTGLPIVASLANSAVSFTCKITYQYTPKFQPFTVSYFHVDLQGRTSRKQPTSCRPASGTENQTYTLDCRVTLRLPNASATGSYYCCLLWQSSTVTVTGNSTFILVRGEAPLLESVLCAREPGTQE
uniref:NFAM1 Ig-like domain-containing protein n=1 Tax=Spermophilus dauricus TaxID=99837 RepID=A0A8C9P1Q2_SPEDA